MDRPVRALASIPVVIALGIFASKAVWGTPARAGLPSPYPTVHAELVNVPLVPVGGSRKVTKMDFDSLAGRSGDLRVRILEPNETAFYPTLETTFGAEVWRPGIRAVRTAPGAPDFSFITMAPWRAKIGTHLKGYHLGLWPGEQRAVSSQYENPAGFIEVTREAAATQLSTHFRLADFTTHDQEWVWPKYVVLREDLLDKLELVLDALESFSVGTQHVAVLSGFRSPQYNARGVGEGMARSSRHQYGDAADIIIDVNRDRRMDDLNHDGRVTFADLDVIDRAVQLVETKHPELVGGLGLYHEMGPSGPFAHIDVRGTRARWTNQSSGARRASPWRPVIAAKTTAQGTGRCQAEGAMAVLCQGMR